MKRLVRAIRGGLYIVGIVLVAAACAIPATPAPIVAAPTVAAATAVPTEVTATTEPITLTLWTFFSEDGRQKVYRDVEKRMQEEYPNFKLNIVQYGWSEIGDKLFAALVSGQDVPDLVDLDGVFLGRFMLQNPVQLLDLSGYLKQSPYYSDVLPSRLALYSLGDALYALDGELAPVLLYYREDIFKQYGIEAPIKTWDDYVQAGLILKEHGIYMLEVGDGSNPGSTDWVAFQVMLQQAGGNVFDKDGNIVVDSEIPLKVLTFYRDLVAKGIAIPSGTALGDASWLAPVQEGKVATQIGADWLLDWPMKTDLTDQAGLWRVQALPAWEAGGSTTANYGGTGMSITKYCKYPDVAWKFIELNRLDVESTHLSYDVATFMPNRVSLFSDPYFKKADDYLGGQAMADVIAASAPTANVFYYTPYYLTGMTNINKEAIYPVLRGERSPEEGLAKAAEAIKAEIAR